MKVEAAKLLGLATIPCIIVGHLTAQEKRLLRLASNRLAENGTWSLPDLKLELEELILEDALLDLTHRGDVVLDPFLGSGSTLIAAESCGRVCCGVELDPLYVDVICRRYQTVAGEPAIHREWVSPSQSLGGSARPTANGPMRPRSNLQVECRPELPGPLQKP